jgi:hypothetical protein
MKTITIKVTQEELEIFANANGFLNQYFEGTQETDLNTFTENLIERIIKRDSIRYISQEARKTVEQQVQVQTETLINSIEEKKIDITIE